MSETKTEWRRLYDENGVLVYEGFTFHECPCGAGTAYFPDGTIYREGVFGIKGLLCGREYYPSGNLRFEGTFGINRGYGPNYPRYGKFLSDDGTTTFEGKIQLRFGGVGYPMVVEPKEFGPIPQACRPKVPVLL